MLSKSDYQKNGILLLDEVYLRSSISVTSHALSYTGLEDFGGKLPSRDTENADHGLVFMWSSLAVFVVLHNLFQFLPLKVL